MDRINIDQLYTLRDLTDVVRAACERTYDATTERQEGCPCITELDVLDLVNQVVAQRELIECRDRGLNPGAPTRRRGRKPGSKNKPKPGTGAGADQDNDDQGAQDDVFGFAPAAAAEAEE